MTEETQTAEQPNNKAEEAAIVQDNEAFLADLRSEINGDKPKLALKEKPEEKTEEEEVEEEIEATLEEPEEAEEVEEEEDAEEEPQGKKKPGEVKRLRDKLDAEKADKAALSRRVQELEALIYEKLTPQLKEEEDNFEPIDPEAQARVDKKLTALEQKQEFQNFQRNVASEDAIQAIKDTDWETKKAIVVESAILDIQNRGLAVNRDEAAKIAAGEIAQDMFRLHQQGKSVSEYFNRRATFAVQKLPLKQVPSGKRVDMVKLDKLRKEAGAPTNKVASSEASGDDLIALLRSEIDSDKKKSSNSYF